MRWIWSRLAVLVLVLLAAFSLCSCGKEKVAGKLDPEEYVTEINRKTLPDMGLFFGRRGEEAEEDSYSGHQRVELEGEADEGILLEYLELLTGPEFQFEIVATQHFDAAAQEGPFVEGFSDSYWSVGLASTKLDAGKALSCIYNSEPCDLYIYGGKDDLGLTYSSLFDIVDTGHRYTGYEGDTLCQLTGEHVLDTYYLKGGKYYSKGNKDFHVKSDVREEFEYSNGEDYIAYAGQAGVILNDGKLTEAAAKIMPATSYQTRYYIEVTEFLPKETDEEFYLYLPLTVEAGEVFRCCDFLSGHQKEAEKWNYMFGYRQSHADDIIAASFSTDIRGYVEELTVRVLQWDDTNESDCLIYLHAKVIYEADPIEIECLIAAPANNTEYLELVEEEEEETKSGGIFQWFSSDDDENKPFKPDAAKLDCLTCGGDGDCNTCGGYGEVERYAGGGDTVTSKCSSCYGSGDCRRCGGSGHRE